MLDHSNHLSSFHPPYQIHGSYDHTGDIEFDFWAARETQYSDVDFNEKLGGGGGGEVEFHQPQFEVDFDDRGHKPLPFWKTKMRDDDVIYESSPLLPYNHNYSINVCPRSAWSQEIAEGRKQLMEMVRSMPESSYELSLKDIVDEQHASQRVLLQEGDSSEDSFQFETEAKIKSPVKKQTSGKKKSGQISRSGSMEKETLMIKMFIPISLISWKTRAKERHGSKVSPRTSFGAPNNHVAKDFGTKRASVTSESKNSVRSGGGGGGSSSNRTKSRRNSSCSSLGCWPVLSWLRIVAGSRKHARLRQDANEQALNKKGHQQLKCST